MTGRDRRDMHARLLAVYQRADQYADLLDAAGNHEKAEEVREEARAVAKNGDLDKVLRGEVTTGP